MSGFRLVASFLFLLSMSCAAWADSKFTRKSEGNGQVIVFVHGVMGDSVNTWTNSTTKAYWPELISKDADFSAADIFVVDFPSPLLDRSLSIDELAENMRLTLSSAGVLKYKDIVILAHSMGGLITRAFLQKYREYVPQIRMLYFYSTPTTGSFIASIARLGSSNPQFTKMIPMTSDAYLADLQRSWLASAQLSSIPSFCAYELQKVSGLLIVEQQSATNLCNRRLDPLNFNHIDMVKPADTSDVRYLAFKSAFIEIRPITRSNLRADIQDISQIRDTFDALPDLNGNKIYCNELRFTLLMAHNQTSNLPVRISGISAHSEDIDPGNLPPDACKIDVLSSRPYGIAEVDTYLLVIDDKNIRAKFIRNATNTDDVSSDNILRGSTKIRAVSLKNGEEPIGFNIELHDKSKILKKIWFTIAFDDGSPQVLYTKPIYIWRQK